MEITAGPHSVKKIQKNKDKKHTKQKTLTMKNKSFTDKYKDNL